MKILFLTDGIHPFVIGGMQKHSLILGRLLAKKGHEIQVVHCGGEGYSKENFDALFNDERERIQETYISFPKTDSLPGHYVRENKKYSQEIFNAVKKNISSYDIIYAQGFTAWEFIKEKKKTGFKAPILSNFHGFEMFQPAPNIKVKAEHLILRKAVKKIIKNADCVYSFGGKIDDILKKQGVSKSRIIYHSNGIDTDWILDRVPKPKENKPRTFTFIGRNERRKGIEELNEAITELLKINDLKFQFNFIGPIPKSSQIESKNFKYFGEIRDADGIKEILKGSDCLVCPSHAEGMPTVILEGMAMAQVILATNVGAVSRMIEGNGILLEKPDSFLIIDALKKIIELSDAKLNSMKKQSLKIVRNKFTWSVIADQKIKDFEEILNRQKA